MAYIRSEKYYSFNDESTPKRDHFFPKMKKRTLLDPLVAHELIATLRRINVTIRRRQLIDIDS